MSICLRRREFMAALGGAAVWPLAARAQQRAMPVIGSAGTELDENPFPFRKGLSDMGYVEGRNVIIEYRRTDQVDRVGWRLYQLRRSWHEAGRSAGAAGDQVGIGHQPQDRQGVFRAQFTHGPRPRGAVRIPDHRHRSLLRPPHHRPRRRAPEPRDELASLHWITSSAVANSVSGMHAGRLSACRRLCRGEAEHEPATRDIHEENTVCTQPRAQYLRRRSLL